MMRPTIIPALLLAGLTIGCAASTPNAPLAASAPRRLPPSPASPALAFTPAVARDADDLDLGRGDRGPFAYAGFEQNVVSVTYTRTDDDQRYFGRGRLGGDDSDYQRRSISTVVTVRGQ